MLYKIKSSLKNQLTLVIASACFITAMASSLGHYFFMHQKVESSIDQQLNSALNLTTNYIHENYAQRLEYDLRLIDSSNVVNTFLSGKVDEYLIHQFNVERLFLSFAKNRSDIYHSIRQVGLSGEEMVVIEELKRNRDYGTIAYSEPSAINNSMKDLFYDLKKSEGGTILYGNPAFENGKSYFFVGISKSDPDIGGFGGAVIITFTLEKLINYLDNFKVFNHSVVWLLSKGGEVIYHPNAKNHQKSAKTITNINNKFEDLIVYGNQSSNEPIFNVVRNYIVVPPELKKGLLRNYLNNSILIFLSIVLLSISLGVLIAKKIVKPITQITEMSRQVASGDFSVKMPVSGKDEISTLSNTFNVMIKQLENSREKLESLANEDNLTGLPNRRCFENHLSKIIEKSKRSSESIALIYIDLDRFKDTNDTYGHHVGDKLIQEASKRMKQTVRQSDLVARLGGDEFAVILHPNKCEYDTKQVAEKLLACLNEPFLIDGINIYSGGSIGAAHFPHSATTMTGLLKNADSAMYKAKQSGRNTIEFYSSEISTMNNERVVFGAQIRQALHNDHLQVYFQPKVNLKTRELVGAEALLRWQDLHNKNFVNPKKIVSIAESSGFMDQLDSMVVNTVCKTLNEWKQKFDFTIPISVNISAQFLESKGFIDNLTQTLKIHEIEPHDIELEITEDHMIKNHIQSNETQRILSSLGFKLAIDDFGTGYSSLSYLREMNADTLKVDHKFVENAMVDPSNKAIVTAIVKLAKTLKMNVVVEGIETLEQEKFFGALGADSAQGFLYWKPMTKQEFQFLLLRKQKRKTA